MPTARSETAPPKKPASARKSAAKSAAKSAPRSAAKSASDHATGPGTVIAERYRDTPYEALVGTNGENVTAVMSAGEAMLSGMAEVSQEMMDFASRRLRQDIECAEDFAKAATPDELFEKQCSFASRAAQQYAEETSKLIGIMARIQQTCWAPMEQCTKAALQGLNGDAKEKK